MLTGTPLDLTSFGPLLSWLGLAYCGLALAIVALALWWPKRWWVKVTAASVMLGAVVYPVFIRPVEERVQTARSDQAQYKIKLDAATAHFEQRCKTAGEKIVRTIDNVEGVVWMKWRDLRDVKDDADQYKLFDPYGRDCAAEECISQLLRLDAAAGRFRPEVEHRKGRYRYVESTGDYNKLYRYTGTMVPRPQWTPEAIEKYRREKGSEVPDDIYWFGLERTPVAKYSFRYGITWDDISTTEDRDHWIAGGSIKVIDLQNNEVIAERVGYMMDRGLGGTAGFRRPWQAALDWACPPFAEAPAGGAFRGNRYHAFIFKVLRPVEVK